MRHVCPLPVSSLRYRNEKKNAVGGKATGLLGLPIYEAAFMSAGAPAAVPVEHTAVCLRRERSRSARSGLLPRIRALPPVQPLTPLTAHSLFFCLSCLPTALQSL